ncbi:hypothetical protein BGX38DRAFT_351299 [Terfezia claveryi]|nr:hypothetical protein BGX38DRAFT_351299 [Terfezia claveryi]
MLLPKHILTDNLALKLLLLCPSNTAVRPRTPPNPAKPANNSTITSRGKHANARGRARPYSDASSSQLYTNIQMAAGAAVVMVVASLIT